MRAEQIFKGASFSVMDEGIDPSKIIQRNLGDCYFLAAVCAVAEHSRRVQRLFLSRKPNPQRLYCVAYCVTGSWEEVLLDDHFAVDPMLGYRPAFSCTRDNQLWVMLLIKAWAKIYGGFLNICGGTSLEVLADLTGAPTAHFEVREEDREVLWRRLTEASHKQHLMCADSRKIDEAGSDGIDPFTGLISFHAFSLVSTYEVLLDGVAWRVAHENEIGRKGNERLVKLRNPWGVGEYKGEW